MPTITTRPIHIFSIAALAAAVAIPFVGTASADSPSSGTCFGNVVVTPKRVHVGQNIHIQGTHFSCMSPEGKLFPSLSLFLYRYAKNGGFHIYTIPVNKQGNYRATKTIPSKLMANSMINGGKQRFISTQPGTYYLSVRLFDVALDPPKQALAKITVLG